MRPKKLRKRKYYTLMLVSNQAGGKARRWRMSSRKFAVLGSIAVIFIAAIVSVGSFSVVEMIGEVHKVMEMEAERNALASQNEKLLTQNEELNNKVLILSDTVNQKVEVEEAKAAEDAQKSEPTGFPLSGTATMTEANANEAAGEGAPAIPMIIFESAPGTKVIAAGNGKVAYVGPDDTDYGNMIKIDHGNGYISIYRNAAEPKVAEGDEVTRGILLFEMGEDSTRLGYEIMNNDQFQNPLDLLEIVG